MNVLLIVSCGCFMLGLAQYLLRAFRCSSVLWFVTDQNLISILAWDGRLGVKTTSDFAAMCIFCVRDETESWDVIKKRDDRCGTECALDSVDSVRVDQHHI